MRARSASCPEIFDSLADCLARSAYARDVQGDGKAAADREEITDPAFRGFHWFAAR